MPLITDVIMVNHVCLMETFLVTIFFMTVNREKRSVPTWIMKGLSRFENCFKRIKVENEKKRLCEAFYVLNLNPTKFYLFMTFFAPCDFLRLCAGD